MIDDPIEITANLINDYEADYQWPKKLFFVNPDKCVGLVSFQKGDKNKPVLFLWLIEKFVGKNEHNTSLNNYYFEKGVFFDRMKHDYPAHFEWLLFHQEWLNLPGRGGF